MKIDPFFFKDFLGNMKGTYILILHLKKPHEEKIKNKIIDFPEGCYLYVGSALGTGGLNTRISRAFKKKKFVHWHIDRLTILETVNVVGVITFFEQKIECLLGEKFSCDDNYKPIVNFGNSDCKRKCKSHLFYIREK